VLATWAKKPGRSIAGKLPAVKDSKWLVEKWGALGEGNNKFMDDATITLAALKDGFAKLAAPAIVQRKESVQKIVPVGVLDAKVSQNLSIALNGRGLRGRIDEVQRIIATCDLLSDDGKRNLLNAPGPAQAAQVLDFFVNELYPGPEQIEAIKAVKETLSPTQKLKEAEQAMLTLSVVPKVLQRMKVMSSTLKRPEVLVEARRRSERWKYAWMDIPESGVLQNLLNGLLRAVNGLHQGEKSLPPITGFSFKMDRKRSEWASEALEAFRFRVDEKRPMLGVVVLKELARTYGSEDKLLRALETEFLSGVNDRDFFFSQPWDDKNGRAFDAREKLERKQEGDLEDEDVLPVDPRPLEGLDKADSDWYATIDAEVTKEQENLKQATKLMEDDYAAPGKIDEGVDVDSDAYRKVSDPKVFAWRLNVMLEGRLTAISRIKGEKTKVGPDEGRQRAFEKADAYADLDPPVGTPKWKFDHASEMLLTRQSLDQVKDSASEVLRWAGQKTKTAADAEDVMKATFIMQEMTVILRLCYQMLAKRKQERLAKEEMLAERASRAAARATKATKAAAAKQLPIGAKLAFNAGGAVPIYQQRYAEKVEVRLGEAIRGLLKQNNVTIDIPTDETPTLLHALRDIARDRIL